MGQLLVELPVFVPQENADDDQSHSHRDEHGGPPASELSSGGSRFAARVTRRPPGRGTDLADQSILQFRRRLHSWCGESEQRDPSSRFGNLSHAIRTTGQVSFERLLLAHVQCAESEQIEIFFSSRVSVHGCKARFNVSSAERRRVFTVPSGSPVRCAISLWVSPSK